MFKISKLTTEDAIQICQWKYPAPYDNYNLNSSHLDEFSKEENHYHSVYRDGQLFGFFCWGLDARVPGHNYCNHFTDVGVGMNPNFTDKGSGKDFVQEVINFVYKEHGIHKIRFTVACNNKRALKVYSNLGFDDHYEFENPKNKRKYKIMRLEL